jgi:hypothetical protein
VHDRQPRCPVRVREREQRWQNLGGPSDSVRRVGEEVALDVETAVGKPWFLGTPQARQMEWIVWEAAQSGALRPYFQLARHSAYVRARYGLPGWPSFLREVPYVYELDWRRIVGRRMKPVVRGEKVL